MNAQDIKDMFEGVDPDTKEIIARKLRPELTRAILDVNNKLVSAGLTRTDLSPPPSTVMNMFRICKIANARIVILGQDPYIKPGEAMGMSFSVPKNKLTPPSLRNIYKCLLYHGLVKEIPTHGDLTNWAKQGVLLLNCALTTVFKKSNAHAAEWEKYTDAVLRELSLMPRPLIFILFGAFAQSKGRLIDKRRHSVLEWGHPSPLNSANQSDTPKNFKYCDVFSRANDLLICRGLAPINWNPCSEVLEPVVTLAQFVTKLNTLNTPEIIQIPDIVQAHGQADICNIREVGVLDPCVLDMETLWIFTDGGSSDNGKANCKSSWGFYITDGCTCVESYGIVKDVDIPGEIYKSSNNRGELTAILNALNYVATSKAFSSEQIILVSDSQYSINSIGVWAPKWFKDPIKQKLSERKNLDIIKPAIELVEGIRKERKLTFRHVNSHVKDEPPVGTEAWFTWKGNDVVDKLCNVALGRVVKK